MADDVTQLALITSVTAAINIANAAKEGKDIVTPIVASGVGYVALAVAGQLWRYDVVIAIAWLFLLSAIIFRGLPLINGLTSLATTQKKAAKK